MAFVRNASSLAGRYFTVLTRRFVLTALHAHFTVAAAQNDLEILSDLSREMPVIVPVNPNMLALPTRDSSVLSLQMVPEHERTQKMVSPPKKK